MQKKREDIKKRLPINDLSPIDTTHCVVGLGKLGLCTAVCFAHAGLNVYGVDIRKGYVHQLYASYDAPFHEAGLGKMLSQVKLQLRFTTEISEVFNQCDVTHIIVPTPSKPDGGFDNEQVVTVLKRIGPLLTTKNDFHVVNIISTVMPGTIQKTFIPLLESLSSKVCGRDFGIAYNPEFVAIGSVIENFMNPDLVLIGASDSKTGDILQSLYTRVCSNNPFFARTSLINAEIAKISINCFCTLKISFANNLAMICNQLFGTNASEVARIIGQDSRIGYKFLKPGLGFGGPCFPRDNEAYIRFLEDLGCFSGLQEAVIDINNKRTCQIAGEIIAAADRFGPEIALLGQAYKPQTYVTERSQSLDIALEIARSHPELKLRVCDPLARVAGPWRLVESLIECVRGTNVAAVLTPWPEFYDTNWQSLMREHHTVLDFWE